uniref:DDE Tnp4 domain-containing protein n=1 Tax=Hucho hucho TaxID=62062 RepID=A0A4W5RNY0_9TELE
MVLMAVCNARYCFTMIDVGTFGREGDAGIFSRSKFGSQLIAGQLPVTRPECLPGTQTPRPHVFEGDEGFPLRVNVTRPYPGSSDLGDTKKIYNYLHSRARRISEDCFGILDARWRILGQALVVAPEKAVTFVKACVALYNDLCTTDTSATDNAESSTRYIHPTFLDHSTPTVDLRLGEWRQVVQGTPASWTQGTCRQTGLPELL